MKLKTSSRMMYTSLDKRPLHVGTLHKIYNIHICGLFLYICGHISYGRIFMRAAFIWVDRYFKGATYQFVMLHESRNLAKGSYNVSGFCE